MAFLIFNDDSRRKVDYNTAAKIYQVLTGNALIQPDKPHEYDSRLSFEASMEYRKKEIFINNVKDVEFDDGKSNGPKPWEKWAKKKNDS